MLAPQDRLDVVPPGTLGRNVGCGEGDCGCSSGHTHGGGFVFRYVFVVGGSLLGVWFSGDAISRSVGCSRLGPRTQRPHPRRHPVDLRPRRAPNRP